MVERMTNTRHVATTLAVALGASTTPTTLTPLTYTGFPAAGQGTLSVGNSQIPASVEIVAVTDWATHPWPILRAQDGSTAVSHAIGDGVATVLSETSLGGLVGVYEGGTLVANTTELDLAADDFDVVLTGGKAAIALASTLTGTFTGSASPNLLTVPGSTTPAPTAEGELWWDTDDNRLVVGTGGGTSSPLATAADLTGFGNATGGTFAHPTVSDYGDFTDQGGDPSSPSSGVHRVYAKTAGLYIKSSGGTVVGPFAAGGGNATYTSAYASPPGSPAAGDLWLPTDSHYTFRYSGSVWVPFLDGRALTLPTAAAGWTQINFDGSTSLVDSAGAVTLSRTDDSADNLRIAVLTAPAAPYVITARFRWQYALAGSSRFGMCWRQSTAGLQFGHLHVFGFQTNYIAADKLLALLSMTWSSATVPASDYATPIYWPYQHDVWLRIADNNTNRLCSISPNGRDWIQFDSQTRTDYLTPEQVGWYVNPYGTGIAGTACLLSWEVT